MSEEFRIPLKIYYEDTDAQGVVYYANYLKYIERARTDMLEERGFKVGELDRLGRHMVVHEMQVKYHRPARMGERLEVVSTMKRVSEYRASFHQEVRRPNENGPLFSAEVQVVCVDNQGNLQELPAALSENR